jgi:hypothetical protein
MSAATFAEWLKGLICAVRGSKVPFSRSSGNVRHRAWLAAEPLEERDCPANFNPNDLLVVWTNTLYEYTTSGSVVQSIAVPYPGGRPGTENVRGVVNGPGGQAYVFNGTFNPYMSWVDPTSGVWNNTTYAGWNVAGNISYGEIGVYKQYIFAPDMNAASGPQIGIVRFDTSTGTATRFASTLEYSALTVGLDGNVYAIGSFNIDEYDPVTTNLIRHIHVENISTDPRGLAVDASGNIFTSDWGGSVYEFDPNANLLNSLNLHDGNLIDMDVAAGGQIVVGAWSGDVLLTTEALTSVSKFQANSSSSQTYVAFADPTDAAPNITSANNTTFSVGTPGSFTVTATGNPLPTLSESGALPNGVTFDPASGVLSGTPAANTAGTYALVFTAHNGIGTDATQNFTLTVDAQQAPAITSANHTTFTVANAGTFTVTTTGTPVPTLSESGSLPSGVSFTDNGNGTASLAGTSATGTGGTYAFIITAQNGAGSDATQNFTLTIDQPPAITSGGSTTFTTGTSGGFTVQTTGFPTAALSETGTLPAGVSFNDNGDGTASLAGTPGASTGGSYSIAITASNGVGSNATQTFTLVVDQAPAITSANHTGFVVGNVGTFSIQTTGYPTAALSESGSLPTGVSFTDNSNGTATLGGTPTVSGTFPIIITAHNGVVADATQDFTLTVGVAPAITSGDHTTFTAGSGGNFTVQSTGTPLPALTENGSLPTGVTFTDNGDGTASLAGTPSASTGGIYAFTITALNGLGSDATQAFTLTVNESLTITSASSTTFTAGSSGNFSVQTSGFPRPALSETGALPAGVTFTDHSDGTASLAGTPGASAGGVYDFTITAHNGVGSDVTQNFTLTVLQATAITSADHATFTVGNAGTLTVQSTGFPVASLTENGSLPAGVSFSDNGDGTASLAGTPDANTGGIYTFSITAHNGVGGDATQSFTLTVDQALAVVSASNTTFTAGTFGNFTVQTTGFPRPALSEGGNLPAGVTFVDNGNGSASLSGTPGANTGGVYLFIVTAHNGVGSDATQTFGLTVNQVPAVASVNHATFAVGSGGSFTVQATGFPVVSLSESRILPTGVSFTDNGNGTASLAGTPAANTQGAYALTITAHNGVGGDATQSFTLSVDLPASITTGNSTTFTVGGAGSFTLQTVGFPIPVISENGALPGGVTFVDNHDGTASLAGTANPNTGGVYTFTITAHNGAGSDATQTFTLTVNQTAAITTGNNTTFMVGSAGGFTVHATGYPTPTLSENGALPSGVTFADNGNGNATFTGTPTTGTGGSYALTITAHNGIGGDAVQSFTLTVLEPAAITSASSVIFPIGQADSFAVQTLGFPVPTLSDGAASLPAGVTFMPNANGTATLAGTPTAAVEGTYHFIVTAHNGIGSDANQSFTLIVGQAPSFTTADNTTFTTGSSGTFTVRTAGYPAPALTDTGSLPAGVTFLDNGNGTANLAGTPAANTGGSYAFTITAHNGVGSDATQSFTLTVGQAPAITSINHTTFAVGTGGSFTVQTTGYPIASITDGGFTLPAGLHFADNGDGTATLGGTPQTGDGGVYLITFAAHNGVGANASQSFTLTVDEPATITSPSSTAFAVGNPGTFYVTTSRAFPVGVALSETGSLPAGVSFTDNGDGTATLGGTPAAGSGGTYTIALKADNGATTPASQNFTLTINQAPAITTGSSATFNVGSLGGFTISTAGFPTPSLSESGTLPSGVTFTDNGNGTASLAGTPAVNSGGTYSLIITARNGVGANASQTFTLLVAQPASVTSASAATFTVGQLHSFTVTTAGFPRPTLSESGSLPAGLSFHDNGNGTATLSGTPSANLGGTYALTLTAHNGIGSDATQNFTLTVDQPPAITSGSSTTFTVGSAGGFTVNSTGFPTPALSESGALPVGVAFTDDGDGTASLAGTPATDTGGTYPILVVAHNGSGSDATQTFTLTIDQPAAITSANSTTFVAGVLGGFTIETSGFPTPALDETGALPSGVTFIDNSDGTASLAGTPADTASGVFTFAITAQNGVGSSATQTFTLTVNESVAITSASSTTFTSGSLGSFTITTQGFPAPALSEAGVMPAGITFVDNHDGTASLSGTPDGGTGGTYALTITAQGIAGTASQSFTLTVDEAATITSDAGTTFSTLAPGTFTFTSTGFPRPALSASGQLPTGVTLTDNGNGTATLAGTPATGTGGSYSLTVTAHNGVGGDATQSFALTVHQPAAITSANSATFIVGNAGSFTVRTTGFPGGALIESGALPAGITFTDVGNGTATLLGTPAANSGGSYAVTLTAHNGIGSDATQTFTLAVHQSAVITSGDAATFVVGQYGSFTVAASGVPTTRLSETGSLPAGVTFRDNGDGTATLSGSPAAHTGETYPLLITAHNGVGSDAVQGFALVVDEATAITSSDNTTFLAGGQNSFTINTTGFPAPAVAESGALPVGVTFVDNHDGTATFAGTAAAGTGGSYSLTITAHNGQGSDVSQSFTLTVDEAPTITSSSQATFVVGSAGQFTLTTGAAFPAATALFESGTLPIGVTFADNHDGTATLVGIPATGAGDSYTLAISAHNGISPDASQTFTLIVDEAPGILSVPTATFIAGQPGSFTVRTLGFPRPTLADGSALLPSGVTYHDNGDGTATFSGTPAMSTGVYPLILTANSDTVGPASTQPFGLIVTGPPFINSANNATVVAGQKNAFTITTIPGIPPKAATITESGKLPKGVVFKKGPNGTAKLSGKPAARTGGTYAISLTAGNGVFSYTQSFLLSVDQAPAFSGATKATIAVGQTTGLPVLHTSGLPIGTLQLTDGNLPAGMAFVDNGDGTASLTGSAQEAGTFPLTVAAVNASGSASETFTLSVAQAPSFTSAAGVSFIARQANTFTITTDAAAGTRVKLRAIGSLPAGVHLHDNGNGTATLTGTPPANQGGAYPITLAATSGGVTTTSAFTLTVAAAGQAPAFAGPANATFTSGTSNTFAIALAPGATGPVKIAEKGKLPASVRLQSTAQGTVLSGRPNAKSGGVYHVTLIAAGGAGTTREAFTLTVDQPLAITSRAAASFAIGQVGAFTIRSTGFPVAHWGLTGTVPTWVEIADNSNGTATLIGMPPPGAGVAGTYHFTILAQNAAGSTAAQPFTLTVRQSPIFTSSAGPLTLNLRQVMIPFVITTASLPQGVPIPKITKAGTLPRGLKFKDNGNGTATLTGTPTKAGTYKVVLTANNGTGPAALQLLVITVH